MADSVIGANIPDLQHLHRVFEQESQNVVDLIRTLDKDISSAWWKGGAADKFRQEWDTDFKSALTRLVTALQDAGDEVQKRATALELVGS